MILGKVIGNVVATRKDEGLVGYKLQVVQIFNPRTGAGEKEIVAIDLLGAGIGEVVLVVTGSGARIDLPHSAPTDATIVGIVDTVDIQA